MSEQKQQKQALKQNNPKIGRPAKTDQQQQFKMHYLENKKKFELQCELLVYIHHIFFEQIPCHPDNNRIDVPDMFYLFEKYNCLCIYKILIKLNELYFKNSSLFPEEKLRYTSIIDITYMIRQIRLERGDKVNTYELILIVFFFLFNEKVVNKNFYDYFKKRVEVLRNGMINGPNHCQLNKMDTLIIALCLQIAIREEMLIEQETDEEPEEINSEKQNQKNDYQLKGNQNKIVKLQKLKKIERKQMKQQQQSQESGEEPLKKESEMQEEEV